MSAHAVLGIRGDNLLQIIPTAFKKETIEQLVLR